MAKYIQIFTTTAKKIEAEKIAKVLVGQKLSACVQIIGPLTSVYKWRGKLKKSKEWLCIIKTRQNHYKEIEITIKKIHPYELPEIISTPVIGGSKEYLNWLNSQLK